MSENLKEALREYVKGDKPVVDILSDNNITRTSLYDGLRDADEGLRTTATANFDEPARREIIRSVLTGRMTKPEAAKDNQITVAAIDYMLKSRGKWDDWLAIRDSDKYKALVKAMRRATDGGETDNRVAEMSGLSKYQLDSLSQKLFQLSGAALLSRMRKASDEEADQLLARAMERTKFPDL